MANENIQVEILRNPTKADWARCKELARKEKNGRSLMWYQKG